MTSGSVVTRNSVTITHNGNTYAADASHPKFADIRAALAEKDYEKAVNALSVAKAITEFGIGKIIVKDGSVFFGNEILNNEVTTHILELIQDGFDAEPMVAFLTNLMLNPSKRAVDELYRFIMAAKIAITEDGHLLAYKKVTKNANGDLVDIHSKTFVNNVGSVVEVPRNRVDENPNNTCSQGLHFCSHSYLPHFGGGDSDIVVIVKIDPKDVVSIPVDYNNAKGRCCRYEVVEVHPYNDSQDVFTRSVMSVDEIGELGSEDEEEGFEIGFNDGLNKTNNYDPNWSYAMKAGYNDGYQEGLLERATD